MGSNPSYGQVEFFSPCLLLVCFTWSCINILIDIVVDTSSEDGRYSGDREERAWRGAGGTLEWRLEHRLRKRDRGNGKCRQERMTENWKKD